MLAWYSRYSCQLWGQIIEYTLDKTLGTLWCPILTASKGCFTISGCHINAVVIKAILAWHWLHVQGCSAPGRMMAQNGSPGLLTSCRGLT